jgi:hypothetical protein
MGRLLLGAILYIINVNHMPVATFDTFRGMTRWIHDYRINHPYDPNLSEGRVDIYKCVTRDVTGEKCLSYKSI